MLGGLDHEGVPMPPRSWLDKDRHRDLEHQPPRKEHRSGEHKRTGRGHRDGDGGSGDLQRALEAQVVEEIRRQNEELRQQVALLQSAASIRKKTVKKAADATSVRSPEMFTPMDAPGEAVRHTPGGTRVPPATPPEVDGNVDGGVRTLTDLPPVPPWPLGKPQVQQNELMMGAFGRSLSLDSRCGKNMTGIDHTKVSLWEVA